MQLLAAALIAATLNGASPCKTDGALTAWSTYWLQQDREANCTCEFWAQAYACQADKKGRHFAEEPVLLWAISSPQGCTMGCNELPLYGEVIKELESHQIPGPDGYECSDTFVDADHDGIGSCIDADDNDPATGVSTSTVPPNVVYDNTDFGFPPWSCGGIDTGAFFISCDKALRLRQYVYCHADCGCQKEFQDTFSRQCGAYPQLDTQCGTTCVCWGDVSLNPFAHHCDCQIESEACRQIPVCDRYFPCTKAQQEEYTKKWFALGCDQMVQNTIGVSPGRASYPPDSCPADPGCTITGNTAANAGQLSCPSSGIATGTTGNGTVVPPPPPPAPTDGGVNWTFPVSNGGGAAPDPWRPKKHMPMTHTTGKR